MNEEPIQITVDRLDIAITEIEKQLDHIRTLPLEEAATYYVDFRSKFDYIDTVRDKWASVKRKLSENVLPEIFEQSNVKQSITLKSGFRVTVQYRTSASMKDKINGMQWLKDNGLGDIITATVNASTLSSVAKTLIEENQALPSDYFNVVTQPTTSVTKAR